MSNASQIVMAQAISANGLVTFFILMPFRVGRRHSNTGGYGYTYALSPGEAKSRHPEVFPTP